MANPIDRMDDKHEKMIREAVGRLIMFLDKDLPRSEVYSHTNISVNVLIGSVATLAYNFIAEEDEDKFIKNIVLTLKANFDVNRESKRRSSEELG